MNKNDRNSNSLNSMKMNKDNLINTNSPNLIITKKTPYNTKELSQLNRPNNNYKSKEISSSPIMNEDKLFKNEGKMNGQTGDLPVKANYSVLSNINYHSNKLQINKKPNLNNDVESIRYSTQISESGALNKFNSSSKGRNPLNPVSGYQMKKVEETTVTNNMSNSNEIKNSKPINSPIFSKLISSSNKNPLSQINPYFVGVNDESPTSPSSLELPNLYSNNLAKSDNSINNLKNKKNQFKLYSLTPNKFPNQLKNSNELEKELALDRKSVDYSTNNNAFMTNSAKFHIDFTLNKKNTLQPLKPRKIGDDNFSTENTNTPSHNTISSNLQNFSSLSKGENFLENTVESKKRNRSKKLMNLNGTKNNNTESFLNSSNFNTNATNIRININQSSSDSPRNQKFTRNLVKNYSYKSQPGKNETGLTKINQDSHMVCQKVLNLEDYYIFGVLDGHGNNGHHASTSINSFFAEFFKKMKNYVTSNSKFSLSSSTNSNNYKSKENLSKYKNQKLIKELDPYDLNEESVYDILKENNYEIIKNSFALAESELSNLKLDFNFSGSTSVLVFILADKIICANAGDSRAIIVKDTKKSSGFNTKIKTSSNGYQYFNFDSELLSIDHKPELENEKKRIISSGGRIEKYLENGIRSGPYRVWLKNENYPGLAMSRSIGDLIATSVGVISEPEIIEFELNSSSRYVVIASDGVWEFLNNQAVVNIVNPFYIKNDPEGACNALIKESTEWWEKEDVVIDDITVIVIFFTCKG